MEQQDTWPGALVSLDEIGEIASHGAETTGPTLSI
jgi:hypothetical protein